VEQRPSIFLAAQELELMYVFTKNAVMVDEDS
jgi:hypothetical protein